MQANIFKITMKSNAIVVIEALVHVNPFTQLWRMLEASCILKHSFLECLKLAKITLMQVLGLMEDEHTFSTLTFMKSKLRNCLNEQPAHDCWDVFPTFCHFEHLPIQHMF